MDVAKGCTFILKAPFPLYTTKRTKKRALRRKHHRSMESPAQRFFVGSVGDHLLLRPKREKCT